MNRVAWLACLCGCLLFACGDDSGDDTGDDDVTPGVDAMPATPDAGAPLFGEKPECNPEVALTPLGGAHAMVISTLEIGSKTDGFDLDHDGEPDNKLAGVGRLASGPIADSFDQNTIVIPFEFFDFAEPAADECVKFAIYLGIYRMDVDVDGDDTANDRADCNDHDDLINRDAAEIPDNFKDDDCDGLADEVDVTDDSGAIMTVASTNTDDVDQDGVTIADGDCDDTNATVMGPASSEVCGDGFDNDCDGNADWGFGEDGAPDCSPYDATPDQLALDPLSFNEDGSPVIAFRSGAVTDEAGVLKLSAGPSLFSVGIPVTDTLNLDLRITGATIEADVVQKGDDWGLDNGRLGGVIDAHTADTIRGLEVADIGLTPEDSLLDATFANILGTIIGLPKRPQGDPFEGCMTPDIDVDRDGLEAFCDSNVLDDIKVVDTCVDGDGTVVMDTMNEDGSVTNCTEAVDDEGKLRFVDGISVEINFTAVPTFLPVSTD